jgi:hypothetical protein
MTWILVVLQLACSCFSTLLPRQGKFGMWNPKNNNTWLIDTVLFNHRVPSGDATTQKPTSPKGSSQVGLGGEFNLRRSKLDTGSHLWNHVGPDLRIMCSGGLWGGTPDSAWRDCVWYEAMPKFDGDISPDLKSRLKWRLLDFAASPDGKSFQKVTFQVAYASPPGR